LSPPLRVMVAAAEVPGHAFPEFALARELRARGHDVLVETAAQWREAVEALDLRMVAVEEVSGVPEHATFDQSLVEAARALVPVMREFAPDVVVSDLATAAPPLAAELMGMKAATLIPTLYPFEQSGLPPYALGFVAPRTYPGAVMWRGIEPLTSVRHWARWIRSVARQLDQVRPELGLGALGPDVGITTYGAISRSLTMVATFPQLEYPRRWPTHVEVVGPMIFELPAPEIDLPPGDDPLVLVTSSTAQDPELGLLRHAVDALGNEPVRVVASMNRRGEMWAGEVPSNTAVVDWVPYAQVMPQASAVVCSGGHGTVVRALAAGTPVLVCPEFGDTAENGARVAWTGAGVMVPRRVLGTRALRWAVRRLVRDPSFAARAEAIATWGRDNDGAVRGADLVERYARR
jgi:UDP:flavonoid glycosyltransferase YjiC (YdhE family)